MRNHSSVFIFFGLMFLGCKSSKLKLLYTPKEFLNKTAFNQKEYHLDSLRFIELLDSSMSRKEDPFDMSIDEVKFLDAFIDTIIYNSAKDKAVVLVITKYNQKDYFQVKETKELISVGSKLYYDGYCYLSAKDEKGWKLHYFGFFSPGNYTEPISVSRRLRGFFFHEVAPMRRNFSRYNFDDVRMWNEPMWDEFNH